MTLSTAGYVSPEYANLTIRNLERKLSEAKSEAEKIHKEDAEALRKAQERVAELNQWLLDAKKLVHGQAALRGALWEALEQVAPDHPLIAGDYTADSHPTTKIINEAKAKVRPDSPWFP